MVIIGDRYDPEPRTRSTYGDRSRYNDDIDDEVSRKPYKDNGDNVKPYSDDDQSDHRPYRDHTPDQLVTNAIMIFITSH